MASAANEDGADPLRQSDRLVIAASSLGTIFEWYDFYLYGLLAAIITASSSRASTRRPASSSRSPPSPRASRCGRSARCCSAGSAIWSAARTPSSSPWGSWACRPSRSACCRATPRAGVVAPVLLVALRLLQGLALGGEYGGAATYVAEHAPAHRRGLYTSFIQTTATFGLFAALLVVIGIRTALGEADFAAWGWRLPFLVSIVLLASRSGSG